MDDTELLNLMSDWNFWGKLKDVGIERENYVQQILKLLNSVNIVVLTGIRRSGKSTIGIQVIKRIIEAGVDPRDTLVLKLDDERLVNLDYNSLLRMYELYKTNVKKSEQTYILLDEAQEVEGWERFVRGLSEKGVKIIVTGSSAKLLSSEYSTLLSGRHVEVRVFPLDFREFLKFEGISIRSKLDIVKNLEVIKSKLNEYFRIGGFPKVVLSKEVYQDLLNSYLDTIIIKDIVNRYKVRDERKIRTLAKYYVISTASRVTFNSASKLLKVPVKTVERYSTYLENVYFVFFLQNFSYKVRAVENSPRKVYVSDVGFITLIKPIISKGHVMETVVAQHIYRFSLTTKKVDMYYWYSKDKGEVDIILKGKKGELIPIQVAYDISDENTMKREIRAVEEFRKEFDSGEPVMITHEAKENIPEIKQINLYEFLLRYEEMLEEILS